MKRKLSIILIAMVIFSLFTVSMLSAAGQKEAEGSGKDKIVIGFSQRRIAGSDWWKTLIQGAEDAAAAKGVELNGFFVFKGFAYFVLSAGIKTCQE